MPLTLEALDRPFPTRKFTYDIERTRLYALGAGLGSEGCSADLAYLLGSDPKVLPSLATVIAWDDSWIGSLGLDITRIVHGEQKVTLHSPLPVAAEIISQIQIVDAIDKGPDRGALLYVQTTLTEIGQSAPLATLLSTVFARGDGGFGGQTTGGRKPHEIPDRAPDIAVRKRIMPNQAHIYRQSGDHNLLHIDPEFAKRAGFDQPILHGLCTYATALRSVIGAACKDIPDCIKSVEARFTAPVYMGETLETFIWTEGKKLSFQTKVVERDTVALDHGLVTLRD